MTANQIESEEAFVMLPDMIDELSGLMPGPLDTHEAPVIAVYLYLLLRKQGKSHAESMRQVYINLPHDFYGDPC